LVNNIPVVVTDVPSIESPQKFEDLLQDPKIIFKGQSGSEQAVDTKTIKQLSKSPPTAMDRARDLVFVLITLQIAMKAA
jgi:hypothetical protein